MLGRTAQSLYWMCRYMERAENMARLLDVGNRMSLTPGLDASHRDQWESTLQAAGIAGPFFARKQAASLASVRDFMLFDDSNPSSVLTCIAAARSNARSVRTAITTEMWESINETYIEYSQIRSESIGANDLPALLDRIKRDTARFRGAMLNTILRDDGYSFCQLGVFNERADNTARILDVKYYILLPGTSLVGTEVDLRQWSMILRAASAHRSYRHVYRDRYKAWNIADFLILRREMPRSLAHCYQWINATLDQLAEFYGKRYACHEQAAAIQARLAAGNMDAIFRQGLHEFLSDFISANNSLGAAIAESYNFN